MHVALGRQWRGLDVTQQAVLYVAAEGSWGIRNRVLAFREHFAIDHMPLTVMTSGMNLFDSDDDVERLCATVRQAAQRIGDVGLIVIDTLARVMGGGDENTASDMGLLVQHVDELCSELGLHVMLVHHSGKDVARGARGSSSLRAATATEIEVEPLEGMSVARVTKQRDLEIAGEFGFGLVPVTLGVNARGKPVTSCVVERREGGTRRKRPNTPRTANAKICWEALTNAMPNFSTRRKVNDQTVISCLKEEWYAQVRPVLTMDARHKRQAFDRAVNSLSANRFIGVHNEIVWIED
jgi:hypothetical protein